MGAIGCFRKLQPGDASDVSGWASRRRSVRCYLRPTNASHVLTLPFWCLTTWRCQHVAAKQSQKHGPQKYVASTWKITTEPDQHDCCACMQSAQSSGSTVSLVQKALGFQSSSWVFRDSWIMSMKREDHCTHDTFWHMATNRIMGKKGLTWTCLRFVQ